jgi:Phage terminase large subunit (GpA)
MDRAQALEFIGDAIAGAWSPPFRGQIYENAAKIDLQGGYAVKGPFDITTAPHLVQPFREIANPKKRLISIMAAVQTLKSLIVDLTVPTWIEHDPGDTLWLFEDDPKAKQYAETRAMPLIRSIPEIASMLADVDRHDKTKTKIKFRHMSLVMGGLNEGNVQSISYRYVIIDEAWLARANGLIRQAKDRTKQYPDTKKILILGQGCNVDEDADLEHKETDQRELHYACPHCGFAQPFEIARRRPDNFPLQRLRGTYAGLSWDTNDSSKPAGRWNWAEVGRTAHHRCYQCDARIEDAPEIRRRLAESYTYVPKNPGAPTELVGFHWPAEASTRIRFADLAIKYLRAKIAWNELGYRLPMQEFWQKDRGLSWSEESQAEPREIAYEPYDIKSAWPAEAYRFLIADCQRDLAKFYYSVFAVALNGESRELTRGIVDSFAELAAVQGDHQVKDQHTFLDCSYQMTKTLRECVRHGHVAKVRIGGKTRRVWVCWTGLKGSPRELFQHINPKTKERTWRIFSERKYYDTSAGLAAAPGRPAARSPRAPWYEWSNLHAKDLLQLRRDGDPGAPKFLVLPDDLPATDQNSYYAQMRSEKRKEEFANGRKRAIWLPISQGRPNHRWDIGAMLMTVESIVGIIGTPAEAVATAPGAGDQGPATAATTA